MFGGHRLANISIDFWWCVLYHKVKKSLVNQRFSPAIASAAKRLMKMARDEARHGKAFKGLLDRYFAD